MFETKSGILLIAGLGFFVLAFVANGIVPLQMYARVPEKTVEQLLSEPGNVPGWHPLAQFRDLHDRYPETFRKYFGDPKADKWSNQEWSAKCAEALREGRRVYVAEACWHCHSQFVRPVSNEERRWGPVAKSWEYQNELQRPVLFGTRRVGPDLSREGGQRSNDWHAVHFFQPRDTSPQSVMPEYPWFFDPDPTQENRPSPGTPNRRGLSIILYMQWQGSQLPNYPYYHDGAPAGTFRGNP